MSLRESARTRMGRALAATVVGTAGLLSATALATQASADAGACSVDYTVVNDWNSGFQAAIEITNNGAPASSWTLVFDLSDGEQVAHGWSGTFSQSGATVTVDSAAWNGQLPTGGSVSVGFVGSSNGSMTSPTAFSLNGAACNGGTPSTTTIQPTTTQPPTTQPPTTQPPTTQPPTTQPPDDTPIYQDPTRTPAERAADLVGRMTLEEKVGQMTLIESDSLNRRIVADYKLGAVLTGGNGGPNQNTPAGWLNFYNDFQDQALSTRLAIPILYGVDSVHGNNKAEGGVIFPHNIGLGATRNAALVERVGRITALETRAMGPNWNYDPVFAVPQDIRWGRTYEGFAENTALVTELASAKLRGLQQGGIGQPDSILATAKHWVGDGGTAWGTSPVGNRNGNDQGDTRVDEATLRRVHIAPYLKALEDGARSVMVSYSSWNGERLHGSDYLINDVLKGELAFDGFVVSDWGGIDDVAPTQYQAVVRAINAGVDMSMVPQDYQGFTTDLTRAVQNGDVPQSRVDDAVTRILEVKFEMGLFERPKASGDDLSIIGSAQHRATAREAVRKSLVLLKNDNALPIASGAKVFVGGQKADDIGRVSGGWTLSWQGVTGNSMFPNGDSILDGIRDTVGAGNVEYRADGRFGGAGGSSDVCIVVVGEDSYAEYFGDSATITLPGTERSVIDNAATNCETLIGVLIGGRPLIIGDQLSKLDAVVAAWLPGSEGGGVADMLYGRYPWVGTLPFTWPASTAQLPFDFDAIERRGCSDALFPYGFGLEVSGATHLPDC